MYWDIRDKMKIGKMYKEEIEKISGGKLRDMKCDNCQLSFMATKLVKSCPVCKSKNVRRD